MQDTSGTRRRVPPRANPEEPAPSQGTVRGQVASVPWVAIALTSAVTTLAGYLTLQAIGAARDAWKRRRTEDDDMANPPPPAPMYGGPYGARPDGSFRLPGPNDMDNVQTPVTTGFGQPLRYPPDDMRAMSQRLQRIEQAILAQQQHQQTDPYAQANPPRAGYRGEVH